MKLAFLVVILCGLAAARSYRAPVEVVYSKEHGKEMAFDFVENLLESVLTLIKNALEKTGEVSDHLLELVDNVVTKVLESVSHLSENVLKTVRELVSKTHGKVQEILQKILDKFDKKTSQSQQATIQEEVANVLKFLNNLLNEIKLGGTMSIDKVKEIAQQLLVTVGTIGDQLSNLPFVKLIFGTSIQTVLKTITDEVSKLTGTTAEALKTVLQDVVTAVNNMLKAPPVVGFHSKSLDIFGEIGKLTNLVSELLSKINTSGQDALTKMNELVQQILQTVKDVVDTGILHIPFIGDNIRETLQAVLERIKNAVSNISGTATEAVKNLLDRLITGVQQILNRNEAMAIHFHRRDEKVDLKTLLRQRLQELIERIKALIQGSGLISEELQERLAGILQWVADLHLQISDTVKDFLTQLKDKVKDKLIGKLRDLIDRLTNSQSAVRRVAHAESIIEQLRALLAKIKEALINSGVISEELQGKLAAFLEILKTIHVKISDTLKEYLIFVKDNVAEALKDLIDRVLNRQEMMAMRRESEIITDIVAKVKGLLRDLLDRIRDASGEISAELQGKLAGYLEALKALHAKIGDVLKEQLLITRNKVTEALRILIDSLINRQEMMVMKRVQHHGIVEDLRDRLVNIINSIKERIRDTGLIPDSLLDALATVLEYVKMLPEVLGLITETIRTQLRGLMEMLPDRLKDLLASILDR